MVKVNIKARIKRHSRILNDDFNKRDTLKLIYHKLNFNIVFFIMIFLLPIYPVFSILYHNNTVYDFYRWDIDEDSILESYQSSDEKWITANISEWSFLSVDFIWDEDRDLTWVNEVINYEVKKGDSFSMIAFNFWVSNNSIYWANNFDTKKVLQPWEIIKIPPVSWLIHQVVKNDTLDWISKTYSIDKEKIISQNSLSWSNLEEWLVLIIPWATKKIDRVVTYRKTYVATTPAAKVVPANWWSSSYIKDNWKYPYKLVRREPQHTFYWWNCTRFVWMYKNVDWGWNANQWLKNAKAEWHLTWKTPWVWAIVVFVWRWYNPRYWHVWIVMDVESDYIIVKDMNYRKLNEITVRKIPKSDRSIIWYIYVD